MLQGEVPVVVAVCKDNRAYERHDLQPKVECLPP